MKLASVNVSPGRIVEWRDETIETGIFKEPVAGPVPVGTMGLAGDRQVDLSVHGGVDKAVYAYSADHYEWWRRDLDRELPYGVFGENLTIEGLDESDTHVGDVLRVGTVLLQATEPRFPCFKLGMRFGDPRMVRRFMEAGRYGVYFRVLEEGRVAAGDPVRFVSRDAGRIPVPELVTLSDPRTRDPERARRAMAVSALPRRWIATLSG